MVFWILQVVLNIVFVFLAIQFFLYRRRIQDIETETYRLRALLNNYLGQERGELLGHGDSSKLSKVDSQDGKVDPKIQKEPKVLESSFVLVNEIKQLGDPSNVVESRQSQTQRKSSVRLGADAYELAGDMLNRGVHLNEVSRKTGLSMSELQLIQKMIQKIQ